MKNSQLITPSFLPTLMNASTVLSMSSVVWAALICVLILALPRATTGKLRPTTRMPSSSSISLAKAWLIFSSQSITGLIGCSSPAIVNPASVIKWRNLGESHVKKFIPNKIKYFKLQWYDV